MKDNLCKNNMYNVKVPATRFCKEHNSNIKRGTTIDYVLIEYDSKIFDYTYVCEHNEHIV